MKKPLLTICIVHYRKLKQLKKTIDCLEKNTSIAFKMKILNQGYEGEGIKEYLIKLNKKKNIEVIFNQKNIGCSPGRNILTKNIDTPFIMMLDDDIYVNKRWDKPVFEIFNNNRIVGAVGFSIFKKNGEFWFTGGSNLVIKRNTIREPRPYINPMKSKRKFIEVDDVCAGAMIYKKKLEKIIQWDKNYFIGFEDLDKGLYLKKSKYKCIVSIQSKFIHDKVSIDKSKKEYNKSRRDYKAIRRSYNHFVKKWGYRFPFWKHIFYKYFCLLPNPLLRNFAYFWLNHIKK